MPSHQLHTLCLLLFKSTASRYFEILFSLISLLSLTANISIILLVVYSQNIRGVNLQNLAKPCKGIKRGHFLSVLIAGYLRLLNSHAPRYFRLRIFALSDCLRKPRLNCIKSYHKFTLIKFYICWI